MARPIVKMTKDGPQDVSCTECGKDLSPLPFQNGKFPPRPFKNCYRCRDRKRAGRSRHDVRLPEPTCPASNVLYQG